MSSIDDATPEDWNVAAREYSGPVFDPVERPAHYASGTIECIDYIEDCLSREEFIGYLRGQVIKYQHRLRAKGHPAQDAGKMIYYGDRLRKVLEREE